MICYSLIKDFEEEYAFQVSRETDRLPNIPGISVRDYNIGNKVVEEERVAKVKYLFPAGNLQSVTGVRITQASADSGTGVRLLRYKRKNKLQWDGGSWTTLATEADDQTLTAEDGSTITVDVRPSEYPKTDAEEIVFLNDQSKTDNAVLELSLIHI